MLRLFIILLEVLATCVALLSPIALFHWLIKVTRIPGLDGFVSFFGTLFEPLNHTLEMFIKLPTLDYQGQAIPLTQGLLGILFTVAFFVLSYCVALLKTSEERMKMALEGQRQSHLARQRLAAQKKEQSSLIKDMTYYVYVVFPLEGYPELAKSLLTFENHGGISLDSNGSNLFIEFKTLEQSIRYVQEITQAITTTYSKLLPMDPQPPYRLTLHAADIGHKAEQEGKGMCFQLIRFAGPNMILSSAMVRKLLDAHQLLGRVNCQSMGVYETLGGEQEVFRLSFASHAW